MVKRTEKLPMYIFSEFENIKKELIGKGVDIIDLSIGDPDFRTPDFIIDEMTQAMKNVKNHGYPPYRGTDEFKKEVANYYYRNFGVKLDYKTEIAALIGSKEGIAHLILGMTDPNDYIIIPDPSYPVYNAAAVISGCEVYKIPLLEVNNYLPRLQNIDKDIINKSKMLIVNYPNNPTGAIANKAFYKELIALGKKNNIVIVNDGAYMDILRPGTIPVSLLSAEGAKEIGVEFGTLSKSYNMTAFRLGFVVGNREVINQLMLIKTNFDSGQYSAIQQAGASALKNGDNAIRDLNSAYSDRRNLIAKALKEIGISVYDSLGTFYVWFKAPSGYNSVMVANKFLKELGVMITPGNAFGDKGEGYCRISLTSSEDKLRETAGRILSLRFD